MIKVWILVFFLSGPNNSDGGGPAVIDNIRSVQECQRIEKIILDMGNYNTRTKCIEVIKKDLAPDCCN